MNEIYRRSCCNDVCENALDDGATAAAEAKNIEASGILVSHLTVLSIKCSHYRGSHYSGSHIIQCIFGHIVATTAVINFIHW